MLKNENDMGRYRDQPTLKLELKLNLCKEGISNIEFVKGRDVLLYFSNTG